MRSQGFARLRLFALSLLVATAAQPGAARAGEAEFHCPVAGTAVEYDTGATLTSTGGSGFRCSYTDATGALVEKVAGFADDAAFLDAGLAQLWPLRLGAEQTLSVRSKSASSFGYVFAAERFAVLTRETISVPAGKFETIVVEQEETTSGQNGHDAKRMFWYAPDLGVIVKSTFVSIREPRYAQSMATYLLPGDYAAVRVVMAGQPVAGTMQPTPASAAPAPTSPRAAASTAISADAIAARLRTLKGLLDQKLITEQEYRTRRKAILDSLQPVP